MKKAIRTYARDFVSIIVLGVIAAGVGGYILSQQRLRFPVIQEKPKRIYAEFGTAQSVTPGQGQTLRVSGIKVGDVAAVQLKDGRARVALDVDPEYKDLIRTDATALLRPKTALKDMFVEMSPGDGRVAPAGYTIPVQNTAPDVNIDEILSVLDGDTRDYLRVLISGAAEGLKGRGEDFRAVYKRFEPLHRDLARVTGKVAERRRNLRRLIHNLRRLNTELATKDDELAQLVDGAATTFRAFASEDVNITQAVEELPSALRQTTATLNKVETFANTLGPSLDRLRPAFRKLDDANRALIPLGEEGTPIVRDEIRPFVRAARPLVQDLRPASRNLAEGTPKLTRSFVVLNQLFNFLSFNSKGREGPDVPNRDEGYLFWLAWLGHNGNALFSTADATGNFRPVAFVQACSSIRRTIQEEPEAEFLRALSGVLSDPRVCGNQ